MQLAKAPRITTSLPCSRGPLARPASGVASNQQRPCICRSVPRLQDTSVVDKALAGAAATLLSFSAFACQPALADLNKFEAAAGGEFGVGTAAQFGEAELRGKDFSGQVLLLSAVPVICRGQCHQIATCTYYLQCGIRLQDLRRSNFTSADARNANFKGTKLQGAYFIKAVTANANFEVSTLRHFIHVSSTTTQRWSGHGVHRMQT